MAAFGAEGLDVGASGLGYPQPVEGEQGDQRVLVGDAEPGGDQERSSLVAVQADGVGFVVDPRSAEVDGREWPGRSSSAASGARRRR